MFNITEFVDGCERNDVDPISVIAEFANLSDGDVLISGNDVCAGNHWWGYGDFQDFAAWLHWKEHGHTSPSAIDPDLEN